MKTLVALALLLSLAAPPLAAQTLDAASQEALAATLRMLRDPALRGPAISQSPQAAGVDRQVQGLVGGSPQLTQDTGGDVGRMTEALQRAPGDPAAFAALLSPATLDRLRALAGRISDRPR